MSRTAVVSRNAAETHTAAVKLRWRSGPMTGRATLTMDPSSGHMKAPTDVSASSCQRRRWSVLRR